MEMNSSKQVQNLDLFVVQKSIIKINTKVVEYYLEDETDEDRKWKEQIKSVLDSENLLKEQKTTSVFIHKRKTLNSSLFGNNLNPQVKY